MACWYWFQPFVCLNTHQQTHRGVSDTRPGVSNTHPRVSNTHRGVSNTHRGVSNTRQGVSNTHLSRISPTEMMACWYWFQPFVCLTLINRLTKVCPTHNEVCRTLTEVCLTLTNVCPTVVCPTLGVSNTHPGGVQHWPRCVHHSLVEDFADRDDGLLVLIPALRVSDTHQ